VIVIKKKQLMKNINWKIKREGCTQTSDPPPSLPPSLPSSSFLTLNMHDTFSKGIKGQSSRRGTWWAPNTCHSTRSLSTSGLGGGREERGREGGREGEYRREM